METHFGILAWTTPWIEESGGCKSPHGVAKSGTHLSDFFFSLSLVIFEKAFFV